MDKRCLETKMWFHKGNIFLVCFFFLLEIIVNVKRHLHMPCHDVGESLTLSSERNMAFWHFLVFFLSFFVVFRFCSANS